MISASGKSSGLAEFFNHQSAPAHEDACPLDLCRAVGDRVAGDLHHSLIRADEVEPPIDQAPGRRAVLRLGLSRGGGVRGRTLDDPVENARRFFAKHAAEPLRLII